MTSTWPWIATCKPDGTVRLLLALAITACSDDSPKGRLDQLTAESDIKCWSYFGCPYAGSMGSPPRVPVEQGVSCMNDALASGARAMASWGENDFHTDTENDTFVFTIDHQVKVVTSSALGPDPAEITAAPSCAGPFRIDQGFCGIVSDGAPVLVHALAWEGCP